MRPVPQMITDQWVELILHWLREADEMRARGLDARKFLGACYAYTRTHLPMLGGVTVENLSSLLPVLPEVTVRSGVPQWEDSPWDRYSCDGASTEVEPERGRRISKEWRDLLDYLMVAPADQNVPLPLGQTATSVWKDTILNQWGRIVVSERKLKQSGPYLIYAVTLRGKNHLEQVINKFAATSMRVNTRGQVVLEFWAVRLPDKDSQVK